MCPSPDTLRGRARAPDPIQDDHLAVGTVPIPALPGTIAFTAGSTIWSTPNLTSQAAWEQARGAHACTRITIRCVEPSTVDLADGGALPETTRSHATGFWSRPPGRLLAGSAVVVCLTALWAYSVPGTDFGWWLVTLFLGLVVGAAWAVRIAVATYVTSVASVARAWRRWLVVPCLALLTTALAGTGTSERARFSLSRSDFDRAVGDVASGRRDPASIRRVGLYPIARTEVGSGTVKFVVRGAGFLSEFGYVYDPGAKPGAYLRRIGGPWWVFSDSTN